LVDGRLLIDASPDLQKQLGTKEIKKVEFVFLTHSHPDASDGLKYLVKKNKKSFVFAAKKSFKKLTNILRKFEVTKRIQKNSQFKLEKNLWVQAFFVEHAKDTDTLGFLINSKVLYA